MREESAAAGFRPPPDDADRLRDFLARHGGSAPAAPRSGQSDGGLSGWMETPAADGWVLRCDWSRLNEVEEIKYSEIPSSKFAG